MAETGMWGAPAGIIAGQRMDDQRLQIQTQALETMGRIAGQPGERALRQAQADLAGGQLEKLQAENTLAQKEQRFEQGFNEHQAALAKLDLEANAGGEKLTVANLPKAVTTALAQGQSLAQAVKAPSLTDPLRARLAYLVQQRVPANMIIKATKELTDIEHSIGQALFRTNQGRHYEEQIQDKQLDRAGGLAFAASGSEVAYGQIKQSLLSSNDPLQQYFSRDFVTDAPGLRNFANSTATFLQQRADARAEAKVGEDAALQRSTISGNAARETESIARRDYVVTRNTAFNKDGLGTIDAAVRADELKARNSEVEINTRISKYRSLPVDSSKYVPGLTGVAKDNSVIRITRVIKNPDGTTSYGVQEILPPLQKYIARSAEELVESRKITRAPLDLED